jgi:mono/diheme cytochrome c family protein
MRSLCALFVLFVSSASALAQQPALNETQAMGQRLFTQSCGVCHTKPQLIAPLYGPALSRESLGGQEDVMREVISNGTPRMPGFRHNFNAAQIGAIVAFLKTVPPQGAPAAAPRPARAGNAREDD